MDPYAYDAPVQAGMSAWLILLFGVLALGLLTCLFLLYKKRFLVRRQQLLKLRGMRIVLPKPTEEAQQTRDVKELVALIEPVYTAISHVYTSAFLKSFWQGQPTFSFELTVHHGEIFFYVLAPKEYLQAIERQIHAQYPTAHIEPALDYDIFLTDYQASAVTALQLQKSHIFPIRTYKGLENDPLASLASTLSKVGTGSATIQILLQPISSDWHKAVEKELEHLSQGKSGKPEGLDVSLSGVMSDVKRSTLGIESPEEADKKHELPRPTAYHEQQSRLLVEKAGKVALNTQIRLVARAETQEEATAQVQTMLASFSQFNAADANGFKKAAADDKKLLTSFIYREFSSRQPTLILTTEELASIYHFPNRVIDTPTIHWLGARKLAPPTNLPKSGIALGYTDFRGTELPVYLQYPDRMRHLYMIGKTGVGKTVLFQNMILQDIRNGYGACYLDPNGDAIEWILRHIPQERIDDVILVDPADSARPLALNLLEFDPQYPEQKTMVINEMISIFDKLYDLKATGGPIFEQYMRNAMLLIMEDVSSGSTLMEISRVLADPEFRKQKLSHCTNQVVIDFWTKEAEKAGGDAALANMVPYITSKLTQFTSNDMMRPIIGQQVSSFNFRKAMDERKIILVSLPKGLLGEMNAKLLGMIISGKIQMAAFSRQNVTEDERVPFFLYVDEFQNFTSKTFATILSEARKYRLSLNITHQYVEQLDDETRSAVMGNVGTMVAWRIGVSDAEFIQKELAPVSVDDLVSSERFSFYIRMLIDGAPVTPFNVTSYAPDVHDNPTIAAQVRERSRMAYGRDRAAVEADIRNRSQNVLPSEAIEK